MKCSLVITPDATAMVTAVTTVNVTMAATDVVTVGAPAW